LIREQYGTPVVIAPHGSLEPLALQKSKWKKKLALLGYERNNLEGAACLHATAPAEVEDFRRFGLSNPIGLVPNGVSEEWLTSKGEGARFQRQHEIRPDARLLLFMSRIAPKKGLKILLSAWKSVLQQFPEWVLVVIGGDEDGHKTEILSLAAQLSLGSSVLFLDPIQGQDKRDAFAAAELFILPSVSEGFPMVVLDALGAGVPSIVTRASAWEDLLTHGCGWWVDATEDGLRLALIDALSRSPAELGVMGERAGELARGRYTWVAQAESLHQIYLWVMGQAQMPDWVRTAVRGEA
jgi:glycosyltransferase involved in cell wall biosynthesis